MEMRFRNYQNQLFSIDTSEVEVILPFKGVLPLKQVHRPFEGLFIHNGKVLPVLGPFPTTDAASDTFTMRPWILVCRNHVQICAGLPEVIEQEFVQPNA